MVSQLNVDKIYNEGGDNDSGVNLATNDTVKFDIAGSTKWTMNSSGNLFPSSTSQGICFGVTSDTASNRLDDYEEGTWTATIIGHSAAPSSSQTATGLYTKIGRLCTVSLYSGEKNTSGASGDLRITGLPFTSHSSSSDFGGYLSYNMANNAANTVNTACWVAGSVAYVSFYDNLDSGAWSTTQIYAGTTYIAFSVTYPVA